MTRQPSTLSYFVICVDYGRKGREAIVDPEMTRLGAVALIRETLAKDGAIAFAHRITMNDAPEDVKDELIAAAQFDDDVAAIGSALDAQAARFDHNRKLRAEAI